MPKPTVVSATVLLSGMLVLQPLVEARLPQSPARRGLTEATRLASIYDTILDARFDEAKNRLAGACPPAPPAACAALHEVAWWWEIQQDVWNRRLDGRLESAAAAAIDAASDWTRREPTSGEAWFYHAGAYAPLSQWRVLRGERLAAARDGRRIKESLERALTLDDTLYDAWFGIGLYHYYADVAPAALKVLRFLLLLPGGDRQQGLAEMLRARDRGVLLRGEADYQMHWLYLWYEDQPGRARELLSRLDAQHPSNPLFLQRLADVEHEYFSDHQASATAWQALLERARGGRVALPALAEARARVGLAAEWIDLGQPARALDLLAPVIRARPTEPHGVLALAHLTLGHAHAGLGDRTQAAESYSRAVETAPRDDPDGIRRRAREGLSRVRSRR
ncbi:MAG: hypothetical protein AB7H96_08630 [Vicinamibacterales bacterium]